MAPRSRDLEEDDQLHTIKKVSLEKSFEEVQQASFDRTDSHDLYDKYIPLSVEELQKQLTQHEKSLSTVSNLTRRRQSTERSHPALERIDSPQGTRERD
jgi:hypothetical protein